MEGLRGSLAHNREWMMHHRHIRFKLDQIRGDLKNLNFRLCVQPLMVADPDKDSILRTHCAYIVETSNAAIELINIDAINQAGMLTRSIAEACFQAAYLYSSESRILDRFIGYEAFAECRSIKKYLLLQPHSLDAEAAWWLELQRQAEKVQKLYGFKEDSRRPIILSSLRQAEEVERELGHGSYLTDWISLHRLLFALLTPYGHPSSRATFTRYVDIATNDRGAHNRDLSQVVIGLSTAVSRYRIFLADTCMRIRGHPPAGDPMTSTASIGIHYLRPVNGRAAG